MDDGPRPAPAPSRRWAAWAAAALLVGAGFAVLGTWQVQRRAWKLDLIERVDQRVNAPATQAPGPALWPRLNPQADEYRHVRLTGSFLPGQATRVQASTNLGSGFWVLTPLRTTDGSVVMVNRGFVPAGPRTPAEDSPPGPVTVTGLLRFTEPGGAFLRSNDPGAGRWYSRDVEAIATALRLGAVAPYFVDQDAAATPPPGPAPVGGLTVVAFRNNHLVYALTWYTLALMAAAAAWHLVRDGRRRGTGPTTESTTQDDAHSH